MFAPEDEALKFAIQSAQEHDMPAIQISPLQGKLLQLLAGACGARRILEIGALAGYSSIWLARALPADGRLISLEVSEKHAEVARASLAKAGVADRAEIRVGAGAELLPALESEPPFDLVFIDADKTSYSAYFEATLAKLAPDGVILVDNVLWSGRVLDPAIIDPDTAAIKAFNDQVLADDRVEVVMLTVRDGVSLIRRRRAGRAG